MAIDILTAFEQEPPELDFVIPGFMSGTVGALVAPGATGKSYLALEAAIGVACSVSGGDLLELQPERSGKVIYFAAEDPETVIIRRLHSMGRLLHPDARKSIAQNIAIEPLIGKRPNIMSDRHLSRFIEYCAGSRLIVLDTLSRIHSLDENSNGDMAQLMSVLEYLATESGASVLFLHHTSKAASFGNQTDHQHASRGASVLTDNARFAASVVKMSEKEAEDFGVESTEIGNFVRFSVTKNNYGERISDRWYRRTDGGVLIRAVLDSPEKVRLSKSRKDRFEKSQKIKDANSTTGTDDGAVKPKNELSHKDIFG